MALKPFETTGKYRSKQNKKVAFNGDHAIYCQNFTAGTTECENYLVKNNPATVLSGPLLSPI